MAARQQAQPWLRQIYLTKKPLEGMCLKQNKQKVIKGDFNLELKDKVNVVSESRTGFLTVIMFISVKPELLGTKTAPRSDQQVSQKCHGIYSGLVAAAQREL